MQYLPFMTVVRNSHALRLCSSIPAFLPGGVAEREMPLASGFLPSRPPYFSSYNRSPSICLNRSTCTLCTASSQPQFAPFRIHQSPSTTLSESRPPLVFIPGLEGAPLPEFQQHPLRTDFRVISLLPNLTSAAQHWDDLCTAALDTIPDPHFILFGESFGAALALRIAAAAPNRVSRLVLLNPGTALARAPLPRAAAAFLPALRARGAYRLAARVLTLLLCDRAHLHPHVTFFDNGRSLFDVEGAPLPSVEHRVQLLVQFEDDFGEACLKNLVLAPTTLIASARDRLLPSLDEVRRLQRLLPNVERVEVLPNAPHAALLDSRVQLANILLPEGSVRASPLPHTGTGKGSDERNAGVVATVDDAAYAEAARVGTAIFAPWRRLVSPWVGGREEVIRARNVSREGGAHRPVLFVGNHAKYGMLDLPLLYMELSEMLGTDMRLRSLAHESHFAQFNEASAGRWGAFVRALGAVPASARNFYALLSVGEPVLLFPGGAREVCRRRGEEYELFWRSGTDFVRPAARFDAVIVPFSAVGADDDCATLLDGQELQQVPVLGQFITRALDNTGFERENLMPLGTPPRVGRYYFKFHEIVDTKEVDPKDIEKCREVYFDVKQEVETGIQELQRQREVDPLRSLQARVVKSAFDATRNVAGPAAIFRNVNNVNVDLPFFEI